MLWLLVFLFPITAWAAAVGQPSDVVLLVDGVDDSKQTNYNYLFTVEGDATYYACSANRCSLTPFQAQPTINATFYQLPEGYQRVTQTLSQGVLAEYADAAAHTYVVPNLETDLAATGTNRTYHTLTLKADNTFTRDTVSRERNAPEPEASQASGFTWTTLLVIGFGVVIVAGLAYLAYWLWKRKF